MFRNRWLLLAVPVTIALACNTDQLTGPSADEPEIKTPRFSEQAGCRVPLNSSFPQVGGAGFWAIGNASLVPAATDGPGLQLSPCVSQFAYGTNLLGTICAFFQDDPAYKMCFPVTTQPPTGSLVSVPLYIINKPVPIDLKVRFRQMYLNKIPHRQKLRIRSRAAVMGVRG